MVETHTRLFKVLRAADWVQFQTIGIFEGSTDDLRDGFIHLSEAAQLSGTLARHFAGVDGLIAVELGLDADPDLRWEVSRGGALFPHLYRPLRLADVVEAKPVKAS